ncbi:MAG TPA: MFS transporter [Bdellovibrio sp.]|uniref:MFS transporter n=1 Tax=Bdellovibrio sp. TaxID=28201 RepID=UPI002EEAD1D0
MSTNPSLLSVRDVLKIPVMRRVWYAQIVSTFGDFLALFAVLSVVAFQLHGTPAQVTWVQISYLLPTVLVGPFAGVFVDRWPLKPVLVFSDLIRGVLTLLLLVATQLWHFYLILTLLSVVSSFFSPAQSVTIRTSVPKEGFLSANSLMQQVIYAMRIIGPGLAGLLVASFGASSCYLIDTVSFLASAAFISSVAIKRPAVVHAQGEIERGARKVFTDMSEGILFITRHPVVSFVLSALAAALFAIGCFGPLIAIYIRENMHVSARMFGFASAMIGLGLLLGSNWIRLVAGKHSGQKLILFGLSGVALSLILMAAIPHIAVTMFATFCVGNSVAAIVIPAQTFIQRETPQNLMGRIGSSVQSVVFSAQIIGLILSGILTDFMDVRYVFAICAAVLFAIALLGTRKKIS